MMPPPRQKAGDHGTFGRDIVVSFGFTVLFTLLAFANSVVVARLAGTEGRGLYAMLVSMYGIAGPVLVLGLGYASTYAVGVGRDERQVAGLNFGYSLFLTVASGLVVGGIFAYSGGIPQETTLLAASAAALIVPASVYLCTYQGRLLGHKRVYAFNSTQLATMLPVLLLNLALLRRGHEWVLVSVVIGIYIPTIVLALRDLVRRQLAIPDWEFTKKQLRYGLKAGTVHITEAAMLRLDYLVMMPWVTVASIGLYATADQITNIIGWGGVLAGKMMFAQSVGDADGTHSRAKLGLACRLLIVAGSAMTAVALATGWFLIPLMFGSDFAPAYVGLVILAPLSVLKGLQSMLSTYLLGQAVLRPVMLAGLSAVAVDVLLVVLLAPRFGWHGVAVGRVLACSLQFALTWRAYRIHAPGETFRWMPSRADGEALRRWAAPMVANFRRVR